MLSSFRSFLKSHPTTITLLSIFLVISLWSKEFRGEACYPIAGVALFAILIFGLTLAASGNGIDPWDERAKRDHWNALIFFSLLLPLAIVLGFIP